MEVSYPAPPKTNDRFLWFQEAFHSNYPGVLIAGTTGLAAAWVSQHYNAPVMLFALLFGISFHFLYQGGRCGPGIDFCSKTVLRTGVGLLGGRITVERIVDLGALPIIIALVGVVTTIGFGMLMAQMLRMRPAFGTLSGGAVGICGASAALAIASILPDSKEKERDTVFTVIVVTTLSTLAMITYPALIAILGLNHNDAGIFLGCTIHDVAQVVGAGYSISPETGDIATYVKLLRVAMLLPVVVVITVVLRYRDPRCFKFNGAPLPLFLVGFAALVVIRSMGWITPQVVNKMSDVSTSCLITAIAAIGMKTSFKNVAAVGWKPVILIVSETVWIASLALAALLMFR